MEHPLVPIGTVSELFAVRRSTLHYWERRGIIRPSARRSGRRYYDPAEVYRISLIILWQETGLMTLDEIAAVQAGRTGCRDWQKIVDSRLSEIDARLDRLTAARAYLGHMLSCPLDNPALDCPELRAEVDRRNTEHH
ncbi:MerR family transcriptional regulator [Streptomyces sp. NPDC021093]|uniref:MerR family transcriptional regulator n=1 Tax=Streptomyces sp. NPDC021093 TaxID=3365112 RepID=UPI0037A2F535